MPRGRRGRPKAIDVERTQDVARGLELILEPGTDLIRSRRLGWLLREWDTWVDPITEEPKMGWREVDSSMQLEALLLRYQERRRHGRSAESAEAAAATN